MKSTEIKNAIDIRKIGGPHSGSPLLNPQPPARGASGTFTTVDLKTVTVVNGIITSIV